MWTIVIALLLIGLALIVIEIVFVPGITVVGLLGLAFSMAGIIICYRHFGSAAGFYVLLGMLVVTLVTLVISFRSGVWAKFSLTLSIKSKVNEDLSPSIHVGDIGKTVSTLRPVGKAEFHQKQLEVRTWGTYVDRGTEVRVAQIESNQIIVEPIN